MILRNLIYSVGLLILFHPPFSTVKAQAWAQVGSPINGTNGAVYALEVYNSKLVVGGIFTAAGGIVLSNIAQWDGNNWSNPFGTGVISGSSGGQVYSMCVYNGDLYVAGTFDNAGGTGVTNIAKWNGSTWSSVGTGINGITFDMMVYNNELYVGGNFTTAGGQPANNIAKWNGSTWSALGSGTNQQVLSLEVHNLELYIGGAFSMVNSINAQNVAKYNGSVWSAVGSGLPAGVNSLKSYSGELFAGNPITGISRWNGSIWYGVGSGISPVSGSVHAFEIYNGKLIAQGFFTTAGGNTAYGVASWDGSVWNAVGTDGIQGQELQVYNNELYTGGVFVSTFLGSVMVNFIAKWNESLGINTNNPEIQVNVFPNPSGSGEFTFITNLKKSRIIITDKTGKLVRVQDNQSDNFDLDLTGGNTGLYFYQIYGEANHYTSGRILKLH